MPARERLIVCIVSFLIILGFSAFWAKAEPAFLNSGQRLSIGLIVGLLFAASLYFLLRQKTDLSQTWPAVHRDDQARDEYVASMSHEIRTPLSEILGVMHLLKRTQLDRDQQRYVATATNSANMLLATINDVIATSYTDTGSFFIESENLNLAGVIEDVASILAPEALAKRLELVSDIDPDIPYRVKGDSLRLRQVLHKLLSNAIKYTESGLIVVYAGIRKRSVEIGVKDTGMGIEAEQQKNLLRLLRSNGDNRESQAGRAGLDLSSSQRLIKAMGGELRFESETGRGSRFYFRLAIDDEHDAPFDWKPPQALRQLSIGILSPLALQRRIIRNMLAHWKIQDIRDFDFDVEEEFDLAELSPCDLLIIDQTVSEQAVNNLVDRLGNICDWRETRFLRLVPQNRRSDERGPDLRLYKPISQSRLYTAVMDIVYKLAFDSEYKSELGAMDSRDTGMLAGRRILLAEDNDINKMIVLEMLEETGVDIDIAANGADALDQLQRQHYDLVLMDIQMPIMDGYQTTRKIRSMGGPFESIPIIAMTAHALEGDSNKSLEAGMDYHVSKPFEPQELISLILRFIENCDSVDANPTA